MQPIADWEASPAWWAGWGVVPGMPDMSSTSCALEMQRHRAQLESEGWGGVVCLEGETPRGYDGGGRMRRPRKSWVLMLQMCPGNGGS